MKLKSILCLLALAFSFSSFAEDELSSDSMTTDRFTSSYDGSKTITNTRYIVGGIASIFPGLGIGHAVQGRWMERGWMFTAGGLITSTGYLVSAFWLVSSTTLELEAGMKPALKTNKGAGGLALAFLLAYIGFKIWEAADVWMLPSDYTIVKESPFQVKPLAFYDQENMNLGLSLNYTF